MSTEPKPGDDWIYVDEGTEYTPEQATRRFLSLSWGHQVKLMTALMEDQGAASACRTLNHEGAMIFATRHTCHQPDPVTLEGEIVTAEPQSIEPFYAVEWTPAPPACRHCRTVH